MATASGDSVASSGDPLIDGLIQGGQWTSHTLTYSFTLSGVGGAWTSAEEAAVRAAFDAWSAVANIQFTEIVEGSQTKFYQSAADIALSLTGTVQQQSGFVGEGMFPDPALAHDYGTSAMADYAPGVNPAVYAHPEGDIFLDSQTYAGYYPPLGYLSPGGYSLETIIHEIGHALGLKHPHDDGGNGKPTFAQLGISNLDTDYNTVMSYNSDGKSVTWGNPSTPMPLDILAIQYLYGVNTSTNTGDNTYTFKDDGNVYTIWDAGGYDTVDASSLPAQGGTVIDLRPGHISRFKDAQNPSKISAIAMSYTPTQTQSGPVGPIDNLIEKAIGSAGSDTIYGNDADNTLIGGNGNDTLIGGIGDDLLDGGSSIDTMTGGTGDDTYVMDNLADKVIENAGEGTDTVKTSVTISTAINNVENYNFTGNANWTFTGSSIDNVITGGNGNDVLTGGLGNDTIDGGAGSDTVSYADHTTAVIVDLTAGTATSGTETDTLANIENVIGSSADDQITGSSANNLLDGRAGADTLAGGAGNDTYVVDNAGDTVTENADEGTDLVKSSVSYSLGANLENLTLLAGAGNINGTGNDLANIVIGNEGDNKLDGGAGADTLTGGLGDDTYVLDNSGDTATELAGQGTDTIILASGYASQAFIYTLAAPFENLDFSQQTVAATVTGNAANNIITLGSGGGKIDGGLGTDTVSFAGHTTGLTIDLGGAASDGSESDTLSNFENVIGSSGNDIITGTALANVLDGGAGADQMDGGAGNDTYFVDNSNDVVAETLPGLAGGSDLVESSADFTLGSNLENLILTGADNISGTGNDINNVITGNGGDNTLDGAGGLDTLIGGNGNDTYIVDLVVVAGVAKLQDTVTELANGGNDTLKLRAGDLGLLTPITLAPLANFENLDVRQTGSNKLNLTGNIIANILTGNDANNMLDGGAGADTLIGGKGDDTYIFDNLGDTAEESADEGTDTIKTSALITAASLNVENYIFTGNGSWTFLGNELDNVITGGAGNDTLAGGLGDDTIDGGAGIDTVSYADHSAGMTIDLTVGKAYDGTLTETDSLKNFENVIGSSDADAIIGNAGANVLDGNAGADTMSGGAGNDTYIVDVTADMVREDVGGGIDLVKSAADSYTLGANVENLTLLAGAIDGTGNALNNIITGNSGDNKLDGGAGADTLSGGLGNDTYVLDNIGDRVTELTDQGTDKIDLTAGYSSKAFAYTLAINLEDLDFSALSVAVTATGNAAENTITGGSGDDVINAGLGADTMSGGAGNDTYFVDNIKDSVNEAVGAGTDTVKVSVLGTSAYDNVEDYVFTGIGNWAFTGNDLGDAITGGAGKDNLTGGSGDDALNGGLGADAMAGHQGDDIYIIDNVGDAVTEAIGEGIDTIQASISIDLNAGAFAGQEIENVTLTGLAAINATGNDSLDNILRGNIAANILDGKGGADTMIGGAGNDTYYVDSSKDIVEEDTAGAAGGIDLVKSTIDYTLGTNVENLTLLGSAINGKGNALNNVITGNGADNLLDGDAGSDTLIGGLGNDTYVLDNIGDKVTELANQGIDEIELVNGYSTKAFAYTLAANLENLDFSALSVAVTAAGNAVDNTITGGSGNDIINGGLGADTMSGGLGNDIYFIDNVKDVVTEAVGEGIDTVKTTLLNQTAFDNVENYTFIGVGNWTFNGNELANVITGAAGNDTLTGGLGNDTIDGGLGIDTVSYADHSTAMTIDLSLGTATDGSESDTLKNIENVIGSTDSDTIIGNALANVLDGKAGADIMMGGGGNDIYIINDNHDVVVEALSGAAGGIDLVKSSAASYTLSSNVENLTLLAGAVEGIGNELANVIIGNDGDNELDGAAGADTLVGGAGNDIYTLDNVGDKVTELANQGVDTIVLAAGYSTEAFAYTLAANLENLDLSAQTVAVTVTGNATANQITGGSGNDVINGGLDADMMIGGKGDDTYFIDNTGDAVIEAAGEGIDTIVSMISINLAGGTFSSQDIENVTLAGIAAINATGNALSNSLLGNSAANILIGGDGNDTLNGGLGADKMIGGQGDDTYFIDNAADTVIENVGEGTDTIQSSISINLSTGSFSGQEIENLILTGTALNATGNSLDNTLVGNASANVLDGGIGADTLIGGQGNDILIGGKGDDNLDGGAGNDIYVFNTGDGDDTIDAGSYNTGDIVKFNGAAFYDLNFDTDGTDLYLAPMVNENSNFNDTGKITVAGFYGGGTGSITVQINTVANAFYGTNPGLSTITFQRGLTGTNNIGSTEIILGTDGNDVINGNGGYLDELFGGKGNDTITGGSGTDLLDGGVGDDTLNGAGGFNAYEFDLPGFGTDTIVAFNKATDLLSFSGIGDVNHDNSIDINDLIASISVTDAGVGQNVTVSFSDGSNIIFKGSGTGAVHTITDLVSNSTTQININ